jgi:RNA polymerase sigma-70 factor (ECF subfamily)
MGDSGTLIPTDSALIARWLEGDHAAAAQLVERHAPSVARFVASLGAREEVDEVVQDTFVRAFDAVESFRSDAQFRTWLLTIAKRLVLDRRRRDRRSQHHEELDDSVAAPIGDPLEGLVATEGANRVRQALEGLSPLQRQVFVLRVTEGLAYDEIAPLVGSTAGSCRVHYHNAVRLLRARVDTDDV